MKILYIRKENDVLLKSFINNYENNNTVSLLDAKNFSYHKKVNLIHVKSVHKIKNKYISYIARYVYSLIFLVTNYEKYDVIHILNLKRENYWMIPFLKKRSKKIIVSIYGRSTYLTKTKQKLFSKIYKHCDLITATSTKVYREFLKYNPHVSKENIKLVSLPIDFYSGIRYITNLSKRNDLCRLLNLDENKVNILCCSTSASYDQHDKVIEQVKKIRNKKNVQLIFLLTYGSSLEETAILVEKIKSSLSNLFSIKIFDSFLSNDDIVKVRSIVDIMINVRTSDQFAGAMIEAIRAGSYLINGDWLKYPKLEELGIKKETTTLDDLGETIEKAILNLGSFRKNDAHNNSSRINEFYNIEEIFKKWDCIYFE